ncbi:hypothetical protein X801_00104 [Opisthorchis viverrini]|uniref:Uncharacterized protein n=1 Tax=Opisthorchis viverrini TaxID=6198 RepID=A0A1S8XBA5_OPIVI|nr:hypothetical protein X801_00104 [Opisthorchis viverrini]
MVEKTVEAVGLSCSGQYGVNTRLVKQFRENIRAETDLDETAAGLNKLKIIHPAVFGQLVHLIDPKVKAWQPTKASEDTKMRKIVAF